MNKAEGKAKSRILEAALELLREGGAQAATVRAIADRAKVGVGLINYHFGSKEELLYRAAASIMGDRAASGYEPFGHSEVDPETRLRQLVRERGRIVDRFPDFYEILIQHELLEADFNVPPQFLPLLREIFNGRKRELELRLIAYTLTASIQLALLRPAAFQKLTGLNLFEADQRELALDLFVNNVLAQVADGS